MLYRLSELVHAWGPFRLFDYITVRAILAGQKTQTRRVVDVARVQKKGTLNSAGWRPFDLDVAADRRAVDLLVPVIPGRAKREPGIHFSSSYAA